MIKNSLPEHNYGPSIGISEEIHQMKYRSKGESFRAAMTRVANSLKDDEGHFNEFREVLYDMRFMPAGRVQSAMGAPRRVTPYNCFVSMTIPDSMEGIMLAAQESRGLGDVYKRQVTRRGAPIADCTRPAGMNRIS